MKGLLTQEQLEIKSKLIRDFMIGQPKLTISEYYSCDLNKVDDQFLYTHSRLERMLAEVKNSLYPKQPEIIFSGILYIYTLN